MLSFGHFLIRHSDVGRENADEGRRIFRNFWTQNATFTQLERRIADVNTDVDMVRTLRMQIKWFESVFIIIFLRLINVWSEIFRSQLCRQSSFAMDLVKALSSLGLLLHTAEIEFFCGFAPAWMKLLKLQPHVTGSIKCTELWNELKYERPLDCLRHVKNVPCFALNHRDLASWDKLKIHFLHWLSFYNSGDLP